jgi:tetratricopeptide (TPR) repeat protein
MPLVLVALCVVLASDVRAQGHSPGVWEKAANPVLDQNDETHREVQALLVPLVVTPGDYWESGQGKQQLGMALEKLKDANAETAPDVRLRFDLGEIFYELKEDYASCARVLRGALTEAPDHSMATHAYFMLAICYSKIKDPAREIGCYDEYLRRDSNPGMRALVFSNRAEAQMLMRNLGPSVADYRAALALDPDASLTHLGLALALDRSGDAPGAMVEAKTAVTYDPLDQQLGRPEVFFMPPYERYYYEAMGAMARAQLADDPAAAVLWWEAASAKWLEYVASAPSIDPWVTLAQAHHTSSVRQLEAAKKKLARRPKGKKAAQR